MKKLKESFLNVLRQTRMGQNITKLEECNKSIFKMKVCSKRFLPLKRRKILNKQTNMTPRE
jgi:hypothetical protein